MEQSMGSLQTGLVSFGTESLGIEAPMMEHLSSQLSLHSP